MHDPLVVVLDIHAPIPTMRSNWAKNDPRNGVKLRRITGPNRTGEPVFTRWRPRAWSVHLVGNQVKMLKVATLWHDEPNGADSGEVCGRLPSGSGLTAKNIVWAFRHRAHCHFRWHPGQTTWLWLTQRCEHCGRRFGRREARIGTGWGSPGCVHSPCSSVRRLRSQRDDALNVALGIADTAAAFRVRYLIEGTHDALMTASIKEQLG